MAETTDYTVRCQNGTWTPQGRIPCGWVGTEDDVELGGDPVGNDWICPKCGAEDDYMEISRTPEAP